MFQQSTAHWGSARGTRRRPLPPCHFKSDGGTTEAHALGPRMSRHGLPGRQRLNRAAGDGCRRFGGSPWGTARPRGSLGVAGAAQQGRPGCLTAWSAAALRPCCTGSPKTQAVARSTGCGQAPATTAASRARRPHSPQNSTPPTGGASPEARQEGRKPTTIKPCTPQHWERRQEASRAATRGVGGAQDTGGRQRRRQGVLTPDPGIGKFQH